LDGLFGGELVESRQLAIWPMDTEEFIHGTNFRESGVDGAMGGIGVRVMDSYGNERAEMGLDPGCPGIASRATWSCLAADWQ
tara:strand:+ start:1358 stop:1603 length:246 start_codon:yes stop_codon:yes gene_type:complete